MKNPPLFVRILCWIFPDHADRIRWSWGQDVRWEEVKGILGAGALGLGCAFALIALIVGIVTIIDMALSVVPAVCK